MTMTRSTPLLAAAALLLSGCAANTYLDAKRNTAPGGQQERDIAAAKTELTTAQQQNVSLSDQKLQREREIERNNKRIRAMEADLRKQDVALASALKAKQVSQTRYNELKKEMDAVKAEMQSVDLQNKGDAFGAPDAKADAAKEARLKDLERRKKDLETALAALAKG
jgi:PBP1b-binding outer membrane lipoprotein LpoB